MLPDAHHRLVRRLYLVTVFVSAALLFAVQPMFTKMVLPRLGGAPARPYFLYAASNVGSFLALIAYPFAVEPFTHLGQQTWAWSVVFGLLIGLIAACGAISVRSRATSLAADGAAASAAPAPSSRD